MNQEEIRECLTQKMAILEKIGVNTATQNRFVRRREMRGLRRLLRERAALIDEFATVNKRLLNDKNWQQTSVFFAAEVRAIDAKQKEILDDCDEVLQLAIAEKARIAAEINNSRLMRRAKSNYVHRWTTMAFSNRLNVKG